MNDASEVAAAPVPPAERGATRIAERVVAKLAAQAAREALRETAAHPAAAPAPRAGGSRYPEAHVSLRGSATPGSGEVADIRVGVELDYPTDIGARCRAVRNRVEARVRDLAGMQTPGIEVDVVGLYSEHLTAGGRVR